jgi:hypothetical protein
MKGRCFLQGTRIKRCVNNTLRHSMKDPFYGSIGEVSSVKSMFTDSLANRGSCSVAWLAEFIAELATTRHVRGMA